MPTLEFGITAELDRDRGEGEHGGHLGKDKQSRQANAL